MRLEQAVPPPLRVPSPALRGTSPSRQGTNLVSRRPQADMLKSEPFRFPGGPNSAWEAHGLRQRNADRQARSLSPRAVERPEMGGARSRTPPALEPAPLRPHQHSHARPHLLPSDAEQIQPQPQPAATSSPSLSSYSPRSAPSPSMSSRSSSSSSSGSITPPASATPRKHSRSISAAISHKFSLGHSRQPSRGRDAGSKTAPSTPHSVMAQSAPPPPPPKDDDAGANDLARIGAHRAPSKKPRKHVPSMCDYLSLEQLEDMWCAQDRYSGTVIAPQKPKGISIDRILEARALMPEEGLGLHPAFRGHALVN